jgi:hypothetical protein
MSPPELFAIANPVAAAAWGVLILAPLRLEWPGRLGLTVALLMAMTYSALIGAYITQGQGDFSSLAGVARLFEHPGLLLAGWVHYLAFDLLVGVWERTEARRIGLSQWLLAPLLFLTFMFGPIGWLLFMAVRHVRRAAPLAGTSHNLTA